MIRMAEITIKEIKNKFRRLAKNFQASSRERFKYPLKIGIMAAEIIRCRLQNFRLKDDL